MKTFVKIYEKQRFFHNHPFHTLDKLYFDSKFFRISSKLAELS